jgi:hypothetical protein
MRSNSILTDKLPCTLCGVDFNCDFKTMLKFFDVQESNESDEIKGAKINALLFPKCAPNDPELGTELRDFISMGEENNETSEKVFDFKIDAGRIFASFMQAYRIDLNKDNLHWWIFMELFKALPDDTIIRKIIDIRTRKIDPKSSAKDQAEIMRMKNRYSLSKESGGDDYGLGCMFARK